MRIYVMLISKKKVLHNVIFLWIYFIKSLYCHVVHQEYNKYDKDNVEGREIYIHVYLYNTYIKKKEKKVLRNIIFL